MDLEEVRPDHWALRLLELFCPPPLYEGIAGDLVEQFEMDSAALGLAKAKRRLALNAIRFLRPSILLRHNFSNPLINAIMLRSYFTVAFRNILKNKVFSAINIGGLAIGLAVCLLIVQFVTFEFSFDTFNSKFDRIYRVTNDRFQNGKLIQHGTIMYPTIGPVMARDYPEIEQYTRLMPAGSLNVKVEDRYFRGEDNLFVDDHFLSVFDFPLKAGVRETALKDPYTMVLTEKVAIRYFGVADHNYSSVLGKAIYQGLDTQPYKVTGVIADIPDNSHLQFDALTSYATLIRPEEHDADDSWTWSDMRHYLVLKPGADYKQLESKFPAFSERYFKGDKVSGSVEKFYLQPLRDAHLHSDYEYDIATTASGKAVWALLIVAGIILIIAWINYINLTTSRAVERAKEVGLRKVMGAFRGQLVKQFIFESVLVSLIAFILAIAIVMITQGSFNQIIGSQLSIASVIRSASQATFLVLTIVMVVGVLIAGFYPAFVLSAYQPVTVLKGSFQRSSRGHMLRKALVVFQFAASVALITGTLVVGRQLQFMSDADLGLQIENVMIVQGPERTEWDSTFITRTETYKHDISQLSNVAGVTTSSRLPGDRLGRNFGVRLADRASDVHYTMSNLSVDYSFFDTYHIPLLAGRKFEPTDHKAEFMDLTAVILNMNAVKLLGIDDAQQIIGKQIVWGRKDDKDRLWTVVGVIGNFHQESLKNPMEPMVFRPVYTTYGPTSIKLRQGISLEKSGIVAQVKEIFERNFPGNAFDYFFLSQKYNDQYKDDNRFGKVISIFTFLGIIISCLGLVGLSSYTALQRTKEIGIRKVMGASLWSIVSLLSIGFIRLVIVATLLALPVAYFSMERWLEGYAYRTSIAWWLLAIPALLILMVAAITMSFQVVKSALASPAKTLKYE